MSQKTQHNEEKDKAVGTAVSGFESFITKHQKHITNALLAVLVIIAAIFAINKWYITPLQKEAMAQTFVAEQYFRASDFTKAMNGDGNSMGFTDIIDQYGKKAGQSVFMYAGICELQLGNYQNAINYLKKYNGKDEILAARTFCCIGDAYVGLKNNSKALSFYEKAISRADNLYTAQYLLKAGIVAEELGNNDKALEFYKEIQVKYPQTFEGYEVNKYISRLKIK
jgi:tetratricopeptide (TPR) repeat protein